MASVVTHAIIGTAGHIDHGKTALIKALTGQDTDRLKEEKERGISIDLGFAYLTLPDGARAGIVDVPGHERFIRNMLAGAHGIDLVLFAIAADDGVMPQSEEHLDILHLLGARRGIFVITKADVVDSARLTEVREEIELLADGTTLAAAPVIPVSSITGMGLDQLRTEIVRQLDGFQARRATGIFRLPLDRAFVIKGHGVVVTGTAMGAEVRLGQKLRVLPGGHEVRVRSIQVHSESVESAGLCQRVALNLTGAEKIDLARGDMLADERLDFATSRFDAWLELRPAAKRALKSNTRVRLFIATAETIARVMVRDEAGSIAPKSAGLAQLIPDSPVVALAGDRFVIRDETNSRTIGGGVVLNPLARRVRKPRDLAPLNVLRENLLRRSEQHLPAQPRPPSDASPAFLRERSPKRVSDEAGEGAGSPATSSSPRDAPAIPAASAAALDALLDLQDAFALSGSRIATLMNIPVKEAEAALKDPRFIKLSIGDEEGFTTRAKWDQLKQFTLAALATHHQGEPLSPGLDMESLRTRLPYEIASRAFRPLIDRLSRETDIVREESVLRLKSHRVQLGGDAGKLGAHLEELLSKAEFQPPELKQIAEILKLTPSDLPRLRTVLTAMEREGRVIKVATDLYFSRAAAESARAKLLEHLKTHPEITAASFRDLLGASRKFSIALLDYFDHAGVTTRVGDVRRLRSLPSSEPKP